MPCSSASLPTRRWSGKYAKVRSSLLTAKANPSEPTFTPPSTLSTVTVSSRFSRRVVRMPICTAPFTVPASSCRGTPMYWRSCPDISSGCASCTTESAPWSSLRNSEDWSSGSSLKVKFA